MTMLPGGDTVKTLTAGFAGNPLCLAVVVLSGIFAVLTYMALQAEEARAHEARLKLFERCFAVEVEP